jgi:hypothetical protein
MSEKKADYQGENLEGHKTMEHQNKSDLPHTLRDILPEEAQDIYLEAFKRLGKSTRIGRAGRWTATQHQDRPPDEH